MPKKWIQKATKKMERKGTKGATKKACQTMGYSKTTPDCLNKLETRGGVWTKRVQFARNVMK